MRLWSRCENPAFNTRSRWECHNLDQVRVTSLNLLRQIGIVPSVDWTERGRNWHVVCIKRSSTVHYPRWKRQTRIVTGTTIMRVCLSTTAATTGVSFELAARALLDRRGSSI